LSAADWPLYMPAMNGPRRMEVVSRGLSGRGYSDDDIDRIMSGNLYRLYAEVIG
jgi:microsomal dipeptidase-like Zn-dependent dipeptidase